MARRTSRKLRSNARRRPASAVDHMNAVLNEVRPIWLAASVPSMRSVRGALATELAFLDREIANKISREGK